ncbi:hypothetical protein ANO14919_133850 [Xylariales sp. No.14919]|nr:hypothetical protein ANO14919_133850 [Xylariales sp. No.14919]
MGGTDAFNPQSAESVFVKFAEGDEGVVSVVMFDLRDEHLGGIRRPGSKEKEVICNPQNVQRGICDESELGLFLIGQRAHRRALRPMITRAVNLSKPISLQYPVDSPGYYCTALFGYSAKEFTAEMTAVAPKDAVPAFRSSARHIYSYFAPVWLALALTSAGLFLESTALWENPTLSWMGVSSALQVLIRWAALDIGGTASQHPLLYIAWYTFTACQNGLVLHNMLNFAERRSGANKTTISNWVTRCMVIVLLLLFVGESLADFQATSSSKTSSYVNVILGTYLTLCFSVSLFRMARSRSSAMRPSSFDARRLPHRDIPIGRFMIALSALSITVAMGLVILNVWALVTSRAGDEALFASLFWPSRFWLIDMPFEPLFLVLVLALALTDYGNSKSTTVCTKRELAGVEWGSIPESVDDDQLTEDRTAEALEGGQTAHTKA